MHSVVDKGSKFTLRLLCKDCEVKTESVGIEVERVPSSPIDIQMSRILEQHTDENKGTLAVENIEISRMDSKKFNERLEDVDSESLNECNFEISRIQNRLKDKMNFKAFKPRFIS